MHICDICGKEFTIKNHSSGCLFGKHKIWCANKRDFLVRYDLTKEKIQEEVNILGFAGFVRKFPFVKFNHYHLFKDLDIQKIKQLICPICGMIIKNNNPVTTLFKHTSLCYSRKEFLEKYSLNKELLEKEYKRLGSVQEIIRTYPFRNGKFAYYELFKFLSIDISISASQSNINTKERTRKSNIENYGFKHNFCKGHPSRVKWEEKMYAKFGVTNAFQREDVIDKIQTTLVNKYGKELWRHALTVRGNGVVSSINKKIFSVLEENNIEFFIEFKLKRGFKKYYAYDILLQNNKIIEIYGDYWHCNPNIFEENFLLLKGSSGEIAAKDKWEKDKEKVDFAIINGYDVLIIWEKEIKENFDKVIKEILKYAKN